MQNINKADLPRLWEHLAQVTLLYLPLEIDGVVTFAPWQIGANVNLTVLHTVVPPKNIVFPQWETYLKFEQTGGNITLCPTAEPQVDYILFGVRPCDVAAFKFLDRVFLQNPVDSLYESKRLGLTVALACNEQHTSCLCSAFGLEPGYAPGADIMLWDLDETLLWQALTPQGEALVQKLNHLLAHAPPAEQQAAAALRASAAAAGKAASKEYYVNLKGLQKMTDHIFDAPFWEMLCRRCLACGICTYLCPTCHCFDIEDYSRGEKGERFRCWDSCMFKDFTLMASGENPRPSQKERVRQRFMHKLIYLPARHDGLYGCVGCGRCVRKCPVSLDITAAIKETGGVNGRA